MIRYESAKVLYVVLDCCCPDEETGRDNGNQQEYIGSSPTFPPNPTHRISDIITAPFAWPPRRVS